MPYDHISELERNLRSIKMDEKTDTNTLINITDNAINEVYLTDTKITMPWIYQILKKNKNDPHWSPAYLHWIELRKMFGKNEADSFSIDQTGELPPLGDEKESIDSSTKREKQDKIQYHIQQAALAIQSIDVSQKNIFNIMLLACTVIGLNKRMRDLDRGQLERFGYNWLTLKAKKLTNGGLTRAIATQIGKTREQCFQPIYNAIEILVNKYSLVREKIRDTIIPKFSTLTSLADIHDSDEKKSNSQFCSPMPNKKFDIEAAVNKSAQLDFEIKMSEERHRLSQIRLSEIEIDIFCLKSFNEKIEASLADDRVIDFNKEIANDLALNEDEEKAWENYAYMQDSNSLYQFITISSMRLFGNYQNSSELMKPLLNKINARILQDEKQIAYLIQEKEQFIQLKLAKQQIDNEIRLFEETERNRILEEKYSQQTSLTQQQKNHPKESYEDKISESNQTRHSGIALARIAAIECNRQKENTIPSIPWWQIVLVHLAGTSIGAVTGWGVGFAIGITLGILLGGAGSIVTIPLCSKLGAIIGGLMGAYFSDSSEHKKRQDTDTSIDNPMTSSDSQFRRSNTHINKELGINLNRSIIQSQPSVPELNAYQTKLRQIYNEPLVSDIPVSRTPSYSH